MNVITSKLIVKSISCFPKTYCPLHETQSYNHNFITKCMCSNDIILQYTNKWDIKVLRWSRKENKYMVIL